MTRHSLLKTGLVATAGLLASDKIFADLNVEATTPASESLSELPDVGTEFDPLKSLREVTLLNFGCGFIWATPTMPAGFSLERTGPRWEQIFSA